MIQREKMNILFICPKIPYPPNRGDKIRSFNLLHYLSRNHNLSVFSLIDSEQEMEYAEILKRDYHVSSVDVCLFSRWKSMIKSCLGLFSNKPLTIHWYYSKRLHTLIKQKIKENKFDLILVICSSMIQYVADINSIPKIIDLIDVDSNKWLQYAKYKKFPSSIIYYLESRRIKRYEVMCGKLFDHCLVVNKNEKELFISSIPEHKISVIPNGVNYEYFKSLSNNSEPNTLIFTGQMDYYPNIDGMIYFTKKILPLIKEQIPDLVLYIVGRNPTKEIQHLHQQDKNIIVTGYVEDTRVYLEKASVCVVPLRIAQGIQNKILEAMAMGIPVITTSICFKGIDATPGEDIIVADDSEEFAKKTIELLQNKGLRNKISLHARQIIQERYNWEINLKKLDEIIEGVKTRK